MVVLVSDVPRKKGKGGLKGASKEGCSSCQGGRVGSWAVSGGCSLGCILYTRLQSRSARLQARGGERETKGKGRQELLRALAVV